MNYIIALCLSTTLLLTICFLLIHFFCLFVLLLTYLLTLLVCFRTSWLICSISHWQKRGLSDRKVPFKIAELPIGHFLYAME